MTAQSVMFSHTPIWVQVWGFPFDFINEEAGMDISSGLVRVLEVRLQGFHC